MERLDKSFDDRVKIKLDEKTIFRNTEYGYKVINEHIKDMLEYIDLSGVSFEDVLVSGVNFKGCNPLLLDPQKVWNKDLSNTVFYNDLIYINDFPFDYFTDFNGVNISGALIESNGKTLNFDGAIKENKVIKNKVLFKKK